MRPCIGHRNSVTATSVVATHLSDHYIVDTTQSIFDNINICFDISLWEEVEFVPVLYSYNKKHKTLVIIQIIP